MAGLGNSDKYACKYRVDTFILMMGAENIKLDASNILSIEYANDYDVNLRAMIKVSLRLDIRRKIWILKNKRNFKVKFELTKIGMDIESEEFITAPQTVWNSIFSAYFNDDDESIDTETMESRINMNEGQPFASGRLDEENYFETENEIDIYLFSPNNLDASNAKFNDVFTKDIIHNCVGRVLTETNHRKVLISPMENDEIYDELIVPELPAYKALIYLDQYCGLYETGAIIYYDVDYTYILNSNGKVTAKRPGENPVTCLYVSSMNSAQPGNGMVKKPGNVTYVSVNESNVNAQKPSVGKNETVGSDAKFIVSDDITIQSTSADQTTMTQRNSNVAYVRKADNKFLPSITKARMEENECILYFGANNVDINAFTPNKSYQVVYEDPGKNQKYGKYKYRLTYSYHCLVITSGEYMDASHRFVLKKASSQS